MINHHERVHDLEGRELLRKICIGQGLDLGSSNRPISPNALTVDIDEEAKPQVVADVRKLPFHDESFDFIVASHILEHIDDTISTLREWKRVLKTGGEIGIMVPHGEFVDPVDLGDTSMTHRQLFTEKTLELFLRHVGFGIVSEVVRLERPLASNKCPAIIAFAIK
jgi:SAM-dependent methyltransferase